MAARNARLRLRKLAPISKRFLSSRKTTKKNSRSITASFMRWDGFFGTTYFVSVQCLAVCLWVALNGMAGSHQAIDPYPFPLLATFLSLEAVLLTSCVLIRQNAIDRTSERRDHLELQINLLAEKESTRSLEILQRIAEH